MSGIVERVRKRADSISLLEHCMIQTYPRSVLSSTERAVRSGMMLPSMTGSTGIPRFCGTEQECIRRSSALS
ncbi:hypothetical protein PISMIDRAFT_676305 [Pisolithus microcarpus 441]|uniref:Uncharacterized protein n=1 Tax=Pisolithus microcarpus 441 TaxID=765257 RepID=A0A0C9ZVC1_9AGAM|nr:hypothetical protein PISMIDRAFT_676305 [Pisolithus microcarpus 441]